MELLKKGTLIACSKCGEYNHNARGCCKDNVVGQRSKSNSNQTRHSSTPVPDASELEAATQ